MVTALPVTVSDAAVAVLDGWLMRVRVDFAPMSGTFAALGVADGGGHLIAGRWCNSWADVPHDGFDGSVILSGDLGDPDMVCTPGRRPTAIDGNAVLATARIEQRRIAVVSEGRDLRLLDLDTMRSEPFREFGDESPGSVSYNNDTWVVVLTSAGKRPSSDPSRRIAFLDSSGAEIDQAGNPFPVPHVAGPRAAALSADGGTLVYSAEQPDNSSWLVFWDLRRNAEVRRVQVIEPHQPREPFGFGQKWVSGIDISGGQILVNILEANGEFHPTGALLVDFAGNVIDLTDVDGVRITGASFLER